MKSKKTLINWLGLIGVASFLSYVVAVIFAPLAYPGYDWMPGSKRLICGKLADFCAMESAIKFVCRSRNYMYYDGMRCY